MDIQTPNDLRAKVVEELDQLAHCNKLATWCRERDMALATAYKIRANKKPVTKTTLRFWALKLGLEDA